MHTDIVIIGGGASGLAAALWAKRTAPSLKVTLAEALDRYGKKLLATGNGRCNIMNDLADAGSYIGKESFIAPALSLYKQEYAALWEETGVPLMREGEGRVYPRVNQASAVLDALRFRLEELDVKGMTGFKAERIERNTKGFRVFSDNALIEAKHVIVATGGKAGRGLGENESFITLLKPLGHSFSRVYPALTCLKTQKGLLNGLKGVRLRGEISLWQGDTCLKAETGEILFQDDGLSGIAAMQLSLTAAPLVGTKSLHARLSPLGEDARESTLRRVKRYPLRQAQYLFTGEVNRMIVLNALKRAGISPVQRADSLSGKQISALASALSDWRIPITTCGSFSEAQVMLGGANTDEFDADTLESRLVKGLYAAGELLDVTGPCGGYNLEWAWASGMLAGRKAAESL